MICAVQTHPAIQSDTAAAHLVAPSAKKVREVEVGSLNPMIRKAMNRLSVLSEKHHPGITLRDREDPRGPDYCLLHRYCNLSAQVTAYSFLQSFVGKRITKEEYEIVVQFAGDSMFMPDEELATCKDGRRILRARGLLLSLILKGGR